MPLEKSNLANAKDSDPETLLENDNSKDLKLTGGQRAESDSAKENGKNRDGSR